MSYSIRNTAHTGESSSVEVDFKKIGPHRRSVRLFTYTLIIASALIAIQLTLNLGGFNTEHFFDRVVVSSLILILLALSALTFTMSSIAIFCLMVDFLSPSHLLRISVGSLVISEETLKKLKKDSELTFELKKMNRALMHLHKMEEKKPSALEKIETQKSRIQELAESKIYYYEVEGSQSEEGKDYQRDLKLKSNILKSLSH